MNEELMIKLVAATRQMDRGHWTFEERRPEDAGANYSTFYTILTDAPSPTTIVGEIRDYAETKALCDIHNLLVAMVASFEE